MTSNFIYTCIVIFMLVYMMTDVVPIVREHFGKVPAFKVGDRVFLSDLITDGMSDWKPIHGEVLRIHKDHTFRFRYDILTYGGDYKKNVYEHNVSEPLEYEHGYKNTNEFSIVKAIDDMICID